MVGFRSHPSLLVDQILSMETTFCMIFKNLLIFFAPGTRACIVYSGGKVTLKGNGVTLLPLLLKETICFQSVTQFSS
jgi:hypothetical protein